GRDCVSLMIVLDHRCHFSVGDLVDDGHQIPHTIAVDGVAQPDLRFDFIAFCYGHLAHVVAETTVPRTLPVVPPAGGTHPRIEFSVNDRILPMSDNDLAVYAHPCHNKPELPVAVGALVQVHEIHVDILPGDIA